MHRLILLAILFSPALTPTVARATTVCPGANRQLGIDVSEFQGNINWAAVKQSGRAFAIARVDDGTYLDPTFATNWAGIRAAGMVRGAYQFFRASDDPIATADILINKVGKLGNGDLPPVLDVEVTDGQSVGTIVANMGKWLAHVEAATGRTPIIYTAPGFWSQLGNPNFSHYTLWVANWQVSCPNTPGGWSSWKLWQSADNGSVPGISGAVDLDEFDGTLAELDALAADPNAPPRGYLDGADCAHLTGWAQDPDAAAQSIDVHVYLDGPAGDPKARAFSTRADLSRANLCTAIGSCTHGFDVATPRALADGKPHAVFVYGIDTTGGVNTLLAGSGKTLTCAPPTPPIAAGAGVKRWISSEAVLATWKLSWLFDLAHLPDAEIAAYANGPDLPAKPTVVQADDGTPEVWVLDGGVRRHVVSEASLAAWRFAVVKTRAADVYAHPVGAAFPVAPFLVEGSHPAVYVLDVSEVRLADTPADAVAGGGAGGGATGSGAPNGVGGGCSISGAGRAPASAAWMLWLFGLGALATAGRRTAASARRAA